ncbi:MAG: HelD family protein [Christensenellales bacterium]|jgi:DNA helicase-2/ATP-dependent DNA helicase PcrA
MLPNHPDAQIEIDRLSYTLSEIEKERLFAAARLEDAAQKLSEARRYDPDALELREMLHESAKTSVHSLSLAARKPYFTRVDFIETGSEKKTYYIGKYGVTPHGSAEPVVIDWRAPVANLYYSGQIGPMHYTAPDGNVDGELTLKRQLGIENGVLETIFDTDVVSRDAYLQSVLGAMTGDRLREIVTTIQAEQNFVIRYPLRENLAVQGVAGSGKTTIALHRIAYLLYAFSDTLRPEQMAILAPNPLFLNFIAGVLPDLGVERVRQTTFARFLREYMGSLLPKIEEGKGAEHLREMDDAARAEYVAACRYKGSMRMAEALENWLTAYEARFAEGETVSYGPCILMEREALRKFLLEDEKPFPLKRRVRELQKLLTARAKSAVKQLEQYYLAAFDQKSASLRAANLPKDELTRKLINLQTSRDQRIKQAKEGAIPFVKQALSALPDLEPMALYREFLRDLTETGEEDAKRAAKYTLNHLTEKKRIEPEDVAPIAMIAMRTDELKKPDVRHVVIDEAQDFSPIEFALLKRIAPIATFTVVGDLMQGVKGYRGLSSFEEVSEDVFFGEMRTHYLVTSYRNTIEIMNEAIRVAEKCPVENQRTTKPVLRHGDPVEYIAFHTEDEQILRIEALLARWREKGLASIAVIAATTEEAKRIAKKLSPHFGAKVLDVNQEEYDAGVLIAPAGAVKGLEFDGVILANGDGKSYPEDTLHARLLYVCLTRALHNLAVLYRDEKSTWLR